MTIFLILIPILAIGGLIYIIKIEYKKMENNNLPSNDGAVQMPSKIEEKRNPAFHLFLYLVSFFSLGFMVSGIITTIFQAINKYIPDDLDRDAYVYYSNDAIKFGLSALIVSIPVYYGVLYLINKKLQREEIRPDSMVRKIITYLAMVAFSAMAIGSLVTLLYNYFDGELTTRFVLKVVSFFLVSIFFFAFYLWEIRRSQFSKGVFIKFFVASLVLSVASMILGFFVIDNPSVVRDKKADRALISDIKNASRKVNAKFKGINQLGQQQDVITSQKQRDLIALEMAKNGESAADIQTFLDKNFNQEKQEEGMLPAIKEMKGQISKNVTYKPKEKSYYELCGEFKRESEEGEENWEQDKERWAHPKGNHCFTFDAESDTYDNSPLISE